VAAEQAGGEARRIEKSCDFLSARIAESALPTAYSQRFTFFKCSFIL
jgi:hypothetical protein